MLNKIRPPFQIMLLVCAVFFVFYPTLSAEICLVDDYGAIMAVLNDETLSFVSIFFPHTMEGGYYRPLIGLSYWLDKRLWFLDEHLMHFECVVAHLLNALLVYFVCRKAVYLYLKKRDTWLPLVASLLFSLHPIVTESVNWISGRTDIMMSTFVLLSVLSLLYFRECGKHWLLVSALLSAGIALLAKEAAFGYLLGIPFLLLFSLDCNRDNIAWKFNIIRFLVYYSLAVMVAIFVGSFWFVLLICACYAVNLLYLEHANNGAFFQSFSARRMLAIATSITAAVFLFTVLRKLAFTSSVAKIRQTVTLMLADTNYTISLFLGATGFYVKKFFLPLPLNFYILEIDPLYDFVGIAVLLLCAHLLILRTLPAIMCAIGFLLMVPALPFAFGTIAWTAYAERYIYLSSAFWVIALLLVGARFMELHERFNHAVASLTIVACFLVSIVTYKRNCIWQTNVSLMRDTVKVSPNRRILRDIYIHALVNAGYSDEAEKEYRYATKYFPEDSDRADVIMGGQLVKEGHYVAALKLYEDALKRVNFSSETLLVSAMRLAHTMKISGDTATSEHLRLFRLERECSTRLYAMTHNPVLLIEGGTNAMRMGSFAAAYSSFDSALRHMLPTDHLRRTAEKLKSEARDHLNE